MTTNRAVTFLVLLLAGAGWCQNATDEVTTSTEITTTTEADPVPPQPERECTKAGPMCATCDKLAVCVGAGDGTFIKITQNVRDDEKCIAGAPVKGALCNYSPTFTCTGMGYFPDPYDCKKFHMCLREGDSFDDLSFNCEEGTSYNATYQDCSGTLQSPACIDRPVPECESRTQIGSVPGDAGLYYFCIEEDEIISPKIYRCPAGRHFDVKKESCVDITSTSKKEKKTKAKKSKV